MIIHILVYAIQVIGIAVPFAGCVLLLKKANSRTSMYLLLANLGCMINNGSYLLLLMSKTHEGADIALKMEYFGNGVFYMMFSLFLWEYLRMKHSKWAAVFFSCWSVVEIIFYFLIWTGDGLGLVFQSLDFEWNQSFGLVLINKTPGIFYMMHYAIICMSVLCGMIYTTVRMFSVQIVSERNNLAKLAGAQFVITASLSLMLYFNFSFDIVPVCASLSILSIIISIHRNEFFGITERGHQWVFDQMEDAFVLVDEMYGYLDSNSYAKKVFTELNQKRKNETVSGDMYRIFTNPDKVQQVYGKYYNKKIIEIRENGNISGYGMLLVDITEQFELMERVRQEKERADEANQAKTAFVSNVSHEIRTPMNAIVGMTQIMLRRDDLSKQNREYLMNIRNSGNALLTIVNDLLDMSKIESGKMELVDEEYNFMTMLSDLGMIILNRIGNKNVELLFDIDPDIPAALYGDELRIRQIIINLMNNATKFTEEGYVCLTVKVKECKQDDVELFISVKDTGQGIREEDISKLFGSFQQVDAKKNHHKEGTGLGLSISKQLVELMNGSIGVSSEYGKGSEFYFTIHQRIIDGKRAAQISDGCQAVIAGSMKNRAAEEMLKKLTESYQLSYADDIISASSLGSISDGQMKSKLFYFTDKYETLSAEEKEKLRSLNAVVCGLHNPMAESDFSEDIMWTNKPLYSFNFCNLIENRENENENREVTISNEQVQNPDQDEMDFVVPDASVLIVDDNDINCMVAEEMLKPLQMQIDLASDGRQALELIQEKKYDLIFMDHLMPVMDGVEAVKELRKLEGTYYKEVPVIALTGNTAQEQREEYIQAGMNDYLSKPIDLTDIYRIIKKWIPDKIKY